MNSAQKGESPGFRRFAVGPPVTLSAFFAESRTYKATFTVTLMPWRHGATNVVEIPKRSNAYLHAIVINQAKSLFSVLHVTIIETTSCIRHFRLIMINGPPRIAPRLASSMNVETVKWCISPRSFDLTSASAGFACLAPGGCTQSGALGVNATSLRKTTDNGQLEQGRAGHVFWTTVTLSQCGHQWQLHLEGVPFSSVAATFCTLWSLAWKDVEPYRIFLIRLG